MYESMWHSPRASSRILPSLFSRRRSCSQQEGAKAKKSRTITYDLDVMCLPNSYPSKNGRYAIPRMEKRAELASQGLIGKLRLVSNMSEDDNMAEVRSVFAIIIQR